MAEEKIHRSFGSKMAARIVSRKLSKTFLFSIGFFMVPITLVLISSSATSILRLDNLIYACPVSICRSLEESGRLIAGYVTGQRREEESFINFPMKDLRGTKIALVNFKEEENVDDDYTDIRQWQAVGKTTDVEFDRVPETVEWKKLFPEWIDEDEETGTPECPEIPMPKLEEYGEFDVVVVKVPCSYPDEGWSRDVFRLQLHLIAGKVAVRNGRRSGQVQVAMLSPCRPMVEIFRCDDLVKHEGDWWVFKPDLDRLAQKVGILPVGSCQLALPLLKQGEKIDYDFSTLENTARSQREAYATVLHSSESYACGAMALAQSIKNTNSTKDLVILVDKSIRFETRLALHAAGWKIRLITRIRSSNARKNAYNEWNYSKLRLWQLTDYDKVIFIDSDLIVLKNLDMLFRLPELSAAGNDKVIFNSGVMVIEPSECKFRHLIHMTKEVVSYNGGDQGFVNEIFTWWHRLPKKMNFLKIFSQQPSGVRPVPPDVYAAHYLGLKPWSCYRDYDCNWENDGHQMYASDDFHRRWWDVYDSMPERLHGFCSLSPERNSSLMKRREKAQNASASDGHWKIKVTDPRQHV